MQAQQPQQQPQAHQQQQQQPKPQQLPPTMPVYARLDDLCGRVEIYRGRHSVVWTCTCARTKAPLILKGYVKARMTERNHHQVRREIRLMRMIK